MAGRRRPAQKLRAEGGIVFQVLCVVDRSRRELWARLVTELSGTDVEVILDRRQKERRRTPGPAGTSPERRRAERRRLALEPDLAGTGYAIVRRPRLTPHASVASPAAVRQLEAYLRDCFRYYTVVPALDRRRTGQAFVMLSFRGHAAHRVVFDQDFLDYHGAAGPERIPRILNEWKLLHHLEMAGPSLVVVSSYGPHTAD